MKKIIAFLIIVFSFMQLLPSALSSTQQLAKAIADGNFQEVQKLINEGLDVNAGIGRNNKGPLTVAVQNNRLEIAEFLIMQGANVNQQDQCALRPLFYATNPQMARLLIRHQADINATDGLGQTVLNFAVQLSNVDPELVKVLLEHKVDVNKINEGKTALDYAMEKGQDEIVKILRDAGAKTGDELRAEAKSQ